MYTLFYELIGTQYILVILFIYSYSNVN